MARSHGKLLAKVWQDEDWLALAPRYQWCYMLLLSQPKLTLVGSLDYMPHRWAKLAEGVSVEYVEDCIAGLEVRDFVVVDRRTDELLIRTFVRHDGIENGNVNLRKGMWGAWKAVQSADLRKVAVDNMPEALIEEAPEEALQMSCSEPMERPSERALQRPSEPSFEQASEPSLDLPPSSFLHQPAAAGGSDERPGGLSDRDRQQRIMQAARQLAEERAVGRDVGEGWLVNATKGIAADHRQLLDDHLSHHPEATTLELMELIDPPKRTPQHTGGVIADDDGVFLPGTGWCPRLGTPRLHVVEDSA